jgi:WD40 repeat protein
MKFKRFAFVAILLILVGCAQKSTPISAQTTVHVPMPISSDTAMTIPTKTNQFSENWEKSKNCVKLFPNPPTGKRFSGIVATRSLSTKVLGLSLSLLDLESGGSINFDIPNPVDDADVSSDGKLLAYRWFNTATSKWELSLVDATGSLKKVAWSSEDAFNFDGWINNHQLAILQKSKFMIVDTAQDSQLIFSPADFSDFEPYVSYFSVSFDPLITRAVYKSGKIILWDLSTKTIIARIEDSFDRAPTLAWQSSGERAAIVAPIKTGLKTHGLSDEIFIVERDGQSRQLTYLHETFGLSHNIASLSWSPDGSKIAFWLPDGTGNKTLMVANVITGNITNYCILNVTNDRFPVYLPAPIWSLDGSQLLVENRYASDKSKLLIVDTLANIAFPIAENANPVGWMIKP